MKALNAYDSMGSAAACLSLPLGVLRAAKRAGCTAFRSNRIYGDELLEWLKVNPVEEVKDLRQEKVAEEVRKLRLRNDRDEGKLVTRQWVAEQIQRAGADLHALRATSERDDPIRLVEVCPGADVAAVRQVLRQIWAGICERIASLGTHLDEPLPKERKEGSGRRATRKAPAPRKKAGRAGK
jgi:hypothetical protein